MNMNDAFLGSLIFNKNSGGGGDGSEIIELCCLNCYDNAGAEIPYKSSLPTYNDYADYLSYNASTRKFEVLQDFTVIITGWVRNYARATTTYSEGRTYINGIEKLSYQVNNLAVGIKAGKTGIFTLKTGDTVYPYTPNNNGYPEQHLKIYRVKPTIEITSEIEAFDDEGANA